jgi:hypothetical protein
MSGLSATRIFLVTFVLLFLNMIVLVYFKVNSSDSYIFSKSKHNSICVKLNLIIFNISKLEKKDRQNKNPKGSKSSVISCESAGIAAKRAKLALIN